MTEGDVVHNGNVAVGLCGDDAHAMTMVRDELRCRQMYYHRVLGQDQNPECVLVVDDYDMVTADSGQWLRETLLAWAARVHEYEREDE